MTDIILNETITHVTDQVTPWPGEAYVTHHWYGEQLHRSRYDAERWNKQQAARAVADTETDVDADEYNELGQPTSSTLTGQCTNARLWV